MPGPVAGTEVALAAARVWQLRQGGRWCWQVGAAAARCLAPHFRMGSGAAVQVTADNISARAASISHWQSTFFPKERQK